MSGWQPIETAPKDGTPILVYCRFEKIVVADWGESSVWSNRKTGQGMEWCYSECEGEYNSRYTCEPTHWMLLPEPPAL